MQLVGVRGSSIHTWWNWAKQGTTVGGEVGVESLRSQEVVVRIHLSVVHNPCVMSVFLPFKCIFQKCKIVLFYMAKIDVLQNLQSIISNREHKSNTLITFYLEMSHLIIPNLCPWAAVHCMCL